MRDITFLKLALLLAKKGMGWTNPNPMVGAVIVKNGKIIGQGFHKKIGYPHAEIEAINSLNENPKGAILYVNLEPCSHFGRTPPCVNAIIKAGITKIICATSDPNPIEMGRGIKKLQEAGIYVANNILIQEARQLNEAFFTFHEKKRPFIALKFASSLDGKIATFTGDSKWITNEKARKFARSLRGEYQSILVGINTILYDNPMLDTRITGKKDPIRIILDSTLKIPLDSLVLRDNNVLIATTRHADKEKKLELIKKNISIITFNTDSIPLPGLLEELKQRNIISILIEGGGNILGNFVDNKLVDKVYSFSAPILIGGEKALSAISGKGVEKISEALILKKITRKFLGDNMLTAGYI